VMTFLKLLSFCQSVILFCQGSVLILLNIVLLWRVSFFLFKCGVDLLKHSIIM
jgi:hypothetical protein